MAYTSVVNFLFGHFNHDWHVENFLTRILLPTRLGAPLQLPRMVHNRAGYRLQSPAFGLCSVWLIVVIFVRPTLWWCALLFLLSTYTSWFHFTHQLSRMLFHASQILVCPKRTLFRFISTNPSNWPWFCFLHRFLAVLLDVVQHQRCPRSCGDNQPRHDLIHFVIILVLVLLWLERQWHVKGFFT